MSGGNQFCQLPELKVNVSKTCFHPVLDHRGGTHNDACQCLTTHLSNGGSLPRNPCLKSDAGVQQAQEEATAGVKELWGKKQKIEILSACRFCRWEHFAGVDLYSVMQQNSPWADLAHAVVTVGSAAPPTFTRPGGTCQACLSSFLNT